MTCPKRVYQSLSEKECCKTGWAVDICATPSIEGFGGKGIEVTTDNECGIIVGGRAYLSLDKMVECFFSLQERAVGKAWARSPDTSAVRVPVDVGPLAGVARADGEEYPTRAVAL